MRVAYSRCLRISLVLWTIILWVGFLFLVLSIVVDDLCGVVFQKQGVGLDGLTYAGFSDAIKNATAIRDQCSNKANFLQIANQFKIIDYNQVNVTLKLQDAIQKANWSLWSSHLGRE